MNKKEPISIVSLLISLVALVIGIILLFNGSDLIFKFLGYGVSGILLVVGVVKFIAFLTGRKKGSSTFGDCVTALLFIAFSVLIFLRPGFLPATLSIVIGVLILFNAINRLVLGLAVRTVDASGSKIFLGSSILMMLLGIIIITQKFFNLLGLFIIIYAISEVVGYVYYTSQNKDYSQVLNKTVPKEIKEKEAKEAVIEEVQTTDKQ